MGTEPKHPPLPENACHEGWRKGRQPGAGRRLLPRTGGPWAGGHKGCRARGWGRWREVAGGEQDHGLGEMRASKATKDGGGGGDRAIYRVVVVGSRGAGREG